MSTVNRPKEARPTRPKRSSHATIYCPEDKVPGVVLGVIEEGQVVQVTCRSLSDELCRETGNPCTLLSRRAHGK